MLADVVALYVRPQTLVAPKLTKNRYHSKYAGNTVMT